MQACNKHLLNQVGVTTPILLMPKSDMTSEWQGQVENPGLFEVKIPASSMICNLPSGSRFQAQLQGMENSCFMLWGEMTRDQKK